MHPFVEIDYIDRNLTRQRFVPAILCDNREGYISKNIPLLSIMKVFKSVEIVTNFFDGVDGFKFLYDSAFFLKIILGMRVETWTFR